MDKELIENKKWLQDCQGCYDDLRKICCDADDNIKVEEKLENHVKGLFSIFNQVPFYEITFGYQNGEPLVSGGILSRELVLYIEYPKQHRPEVLEWFEKSFYTKYDNVQVSITNSNQCIYFKIKDIIHDISQAQIHDLHKQLAEESSCSFLNSDSESIQSYICKCIDEDPHYLGVRFIDYTGKYPIYCDGDVILEIEGEEVVLSSYDVWGGFGFDNWNKILENCDLKWYERYRYEIIRVIKENIDNVCCGGCE